MVDTLNRSTPGQQWIPLDGIQALTTVINNGPNNVNFNPASGIVIKTFLNQTTGEIRLYPAKIFGFPEVTNI
mgnify:CR=1 FL=1